MVKSHIRVLPSASDRISCVLVLQGGGALGAYHIGAYHALQEYGFEPDWLCGISIGAINAAVLAGNPPETRLARLQSLWETISWPDLFPSFGSNPFRSWTNELSNAQALTFGQPAFFSPRLINPYLALPGAAATSFYDTKPMLETLKAYADFDLINSGSPRLTVGATDVQSGQLTFFDTASKDGPIGPEQVLASGSLPPGFPPTEVNGRPYWDGGCISNTPLEAVLNDMPEHHTVVFMVDLWSASGPPPTTMSDVLWRAKQIQYASRSEHHVDAVATKVNLRRALNLLRQHDAGLISGPISGEVEPTTDQRLDIVHIIYHPGPDQIPSSDAEFSRASIAERRAAGYADMTKALAEAPWHNTEKPAHLGAMVHRVSRGRVSTLAEPNLHSTTDRNAPVLAVA